MNKEFKRDQKENTMNDKTHNLKCLICNEVKTSQNAMLYHLRKKHKQKKMKIGVNWKWVKSTKKLKKKTTKKKIETPTTQYIDIQAIIRIPVSIGRVQILARD